MRRAPKVLATGQFDCPNCGESRAYQLLARSRGRRFPFAALIFGRPMRPVLECEGCGTAFEPGAARRDGEVIVAAALEGALCDMLAGMALSDGEIADDEREMIADLLAALEIPAGPFEARLAEWAEAPPTEAMLLDRLCDAAPYLDGKGRALMLEAAYHLAQVDRNFHSREEAFLRAVAGALGIRRGEYEIILDLAGADAALFTALQDYLARFDDQPGPEGDGLVFAR